MKITYNYNVNIMYSLFFANANEDNL